MPTTAEDNWRICLDRLSQHLTSQVIKTWFEPIEPRSIEVTKDGQQLHLDVPSRFFYEWLENRYNTILADTVDDVFGAGTEVCFRVDPAIESADPTQIALNPVENANKGQSEGISVHAVAEAVHRRATRPPSQVGRRTEHRPATGMPLGSSRSSSDQGRVTGFGHENQLNPSYTFETFIEGDCNRLARSAAQAIAESPGGTSFNPFLVYGGVGLGKTHLAHAIANSAIARGWRGRAFYVSSERFTSEFVHAIQENRVGDFTRFYHQVDLLVVDDVEFFGGKEKTQEEFFHVFNDLHQSGKQIILSADRPPRDIAGIEERLLSRFQWGLIADVKPPALETRIAILQRKARAINLELNPDVVEFVAHRVKSNVRKLEGALVRLAAYAHLHGKDIDLGFATDILQDFFDHRPAPLEIEDIKKKVAAFYRMDLDLLSAKTRRREIAQARQVAMYCCKHFTKHPLKTIGLRFGGRDHSTVIHACRSVENRLDTEPTFRQELDRLQSELMVRANPVS